MSSFAFCMLGPPRLILKIVSQCPINDIYGTKGKKKLEVHIKFFIIQKRCAFGHLRYLGVQNINEKRSMTKL
uniref:Uncharacterized protein n=1 Tax=Pararge aegeria TaxID=116150 RepID=S4PT67_9NEOP